MSKKTDKKGSFFNYFDSSLLKSNVLLSTNSKEDYKGYECKELFIISKYLVIVLNISVYKNYYKINYNVLNNYTNLTEEINVLYKYSFKDSDFVDRNGIKSIQISNRETNLTITKKNNKLNLYFIKQNHTRNENNNTVNIACEAEFDLVDDYINYSQINSYNGKNFGIAFSKSHMLLEPNGYAITTNGVSHFSKDISKGMMISNKLLYVKKQFQISAHLSTQLANGELLSLDISNGVTDNAEFNKSVVITNNNQYYLDKIDISNPFNYKQSKKSQTSFSVVKIVGENFNATFTPINLTCAKFKYKNIDHRVKYFIGKYNGELKLKYGKKVDLINNLGIIKIWDYNKK